MRKPKRLLIILSILYAFSINSYAKKDNYNYILVHGAWHGAWTWYEVEYLLLKAGHTVTSIDLPAHGLDTTSAGNVTLNDYQNSIVKVLDRFEDPSILVGHSMGGIAISMAAELRPAKVSKLIYVAAFMLQNGQSMIQAAMSDTESMILPAIRVDTIHRIIDIDKTYVRDIFYGSSSEKYTVLSEKLLSPEPMIPLVTPLTLTNNYNSVRRFYITTTYDKAITPSMQKKMYTALPCEKVYTIHSEHSPFFSSPDNLKNLLIKIAKDDSIKESQILEEENNKAESDKTISIYPNPSTGIIHIENVVELSDIYVYDMTGELKAKKNNFSTGKVSIDLEGNTPGQYLVKIKSKGYTISKIINYSK